MILSRKNFLRGLLAVPAAAQVNADETKPAIEEPYQQPTATIVLIAEDLFDPSKEMRFLSKTIRCRIEPGPVKTHIIADEKIIFEHQNNGGTITVVALEIIFNLPGFPSCFANRPHRIPLWQGCFTFSDIGTIYPLVFDHDLIMSI